MVSVWVDQFSTQLIHIGSNKLSQANLESCANSTSHPSVPASLSWLWSFPFSCGSRGDEEHHREQASIDESSWAESLCHPRSHKTMMMTTNSWASDASRILFLHVSPPLLRYVSPLFNLFFRRALSLLGASDKTWPAEGPRCRRGSQVSQVFAMFETTKLAYQKIAVHKICTQQFSANIYIYIDICI